MITNADITIYNTKINPRSRLPEYNKTIIEGIHIYTDQKISVDASGAHSADIYKIRIPVDAFCEGKIYVSPEEYHSMDDISDVWTIQNADIAVIGKVLEDIVKPSDILNKYKDSSFQICSWSDNRFGSLPHWRIGGIR